MVAAAVALKPDCFDTAKREFAFATMNVSLESERSQKQ